MGRRRPDDHGDQENWTGSYYSLALELGSVDGATVARALAFLWDLAGIEAPPGLARPTSALQFDADGNPGKFEGTVTLPSGRRLVCVVFWCRFESSVWLEFSLPMGALARTDSRIGGFPFGSTVQQLEWRSELDAHLARLGLQLHAEIPVLQGGIGFEVEMNPLAGSPADSPPTREEGWLWGTPLTYYPATSELSIGVREA